MPPFEALCGRNCRMPVCWEEVGTRIFHGPTIIADTAVKVLQVREKLKTAQSRQKSYADNRRMKLEFQVGDGVFFKTSSMKGTIQIGQKGKLSSRYVGPFEIKSKIGDIAYWLKFASEFTGVHDVFHASMLRKYVRDLSHVIQYDEVQIKPDSTYVERPLRIIDEKEQVLLTRTIRWVKLLWDHQGLEEAMWELEE